VIFVARSVTDGPDHSRATERKLWGKSFRVPGFCHAWRVTDTIGDSCHRRLKLRQITVRRAQHAGDFTGDTHSPSPWTRRQSNPFTPTGRAYIARHVMSLARLHAQHTHARQSWPDLANHQRKYNLIYLATPLHDSHLADSYQVCRATPWLHAV